MPGLLGFIPWIAYAIIATGDEWRWGAITGLATALVLVVIDRIKGKNWDEMVIESSAVVFFAIITALSLADPDSPLTMYGPALVNLWLAGTAWGSLAIRRPFTLGIARSMTPSDVHHRPEFYRVNVVITAAWAVAFTFAALALTWVLSVAPHATAVVITVKVVTFVAPALFTGWYPKHLRAKYRIQP
ncbi:hypothetical protein [Nonomuraea endophytica]|uniref:DUF3159 domain-containing protein n=1 Tax=Nonomuraea endophytica TaxID=714136 RepID=A0A7W8EEB2_9ACTN|nr:hypothetical protein [Nonomuraea endophytica]MBB5076136.1 hypothetical protein [Nonomuraea endophytica]